MKKYIYIALGALMTAYSCIDHRYDNMIDDTAYFVTSDFQRATAVVVNDDDYNCEFWLYKAGQKGSKFEGEIVLDKNYLDNYNNFNNTSYEALNSKYVEFPEHIVIESDQVDIPVGISVKTNALINDLGYGVYYIPMGVNSKNDKVGVNKEKSNILLALTIRQPMLQFDFEENNISVDLNSISSASYKINLPTYLDIAAPEDIRVSYVIDNTLLGEDDNALDPQYFSFTNQITMEKGETDINNVLSIDVNAVPRGRWIAALTLQSDNSKIGVAPEAFVKIAVSKGSMDDLIWNTEHISNGVISAPTEETDDIVVATTGNIDAVVTSSENWLNGYFDADAQEVRVNVFANPSYCKEREAVLTVKDRATSLEKSITVKQSISGFGSVLNKSNWNVIPDSENLKGCPVERYKLMYNNTWPSKESESAGSFFEYEEPTGTSLDTNPYILIFDLGENPMGYNSFGMMPRLQWTKPSPSCVKIEVSNDSQNWTTVIDKTSNNGFSEAELSPSGNFGGQYDPVIMKWYNLGNRNDRYIRLHIYGSYYWRVICINEVFVSKK